MKNALRDMWAPKRYDRETDKYVSLESKISAEEREIIRENLVAAAIAAPPRIRFAKSLYNARGRRRSHLPLCLAACTHLAPS